VVNERAFHLFDKSVSNSHPCRHAHRTLRLACRHSFHSNIHRCAPATFRQRISDLIELVIRVRTVLLSAVLAVDTTGKVSPTLRSHTLRPRDKSRPRLELLRQRTACFLESSVTIREFELIEAARRCPKPTRSPRASNGVLNSPSVKIRRA
jgi:hypothetical protein